MWSQESGNLARARPGVGENDWWDLLLRPWWCGFSRSAVKRGVPHGPADLRAFSPKRSCRPSIQKIANRVRMQRYPRLIVKNKIHTKICFILVGRLLHDSGIRDEAVARKLGRHRCGRRNNVPGLSPVLRTCIPGSSVSLFLASVAS